MYNSATVYAAVYSLTNATHESVDLAIPRGCIKKFEIHYMVCSLYQIRRRNYFYGHLKKER
jgi:hypothetical protein